MVPIMILLLYGQFKNSNVIVEIQQEIQILNLINGLELSNYQMEFILKKAKDAEKIRADFQKKLKRNEDQIIEIYEQLKESRIKDETIPNTLRNRIYYTEGKLHGYKENLSDSLKKLAQEVKNILEGNQIYALEHYIACLIPLPGESRIGQSEKPFALTKHLARIREIPDWLYETKRCEIADKIVEKIENRLPPGALFNEYAERVRIFGLLDEIRDLSDVDFVLKQEEYMEKIKGDYFPKEIPVDLTSKIESFLLNPLIIAILGDKLTT